MHLGRTYGRRAAGREDTVFRYMGYKVYLSELRDIKVAKVAPRESDWNANETDVNRAAPQWDEDILCTMGFDAPPCDAKDTEEEAWDRYMERLEQELFTD